MQNTIPHLTYHQFQRVRGLVHQCCNHDKGNCLLLDNGWETCVCVQSISRSLICKYFRAAVLPLDRELETALLYKMNSGGAVYPDEVNDICTKQDENNRLFGEILEQLSRLK